MAEREGRPSKLFFMDRNGENEEDVEESDTDDDNNNEIINVDNDDYQVEDDQSEDNNEDEQEEEEDDNQNQVTTRSGRIIRQPNNYIPSFNGQRYEELINNNIQFNETLEYDDNFVHVFEKVINHHIFKKYGLKKGLKVFGEAGKEAAFKEMEKLHLRKCFKPLEIDYLSKEEKQKALGSLIILKKKESGELKGRACADGRKQRDNVPKEEAASPTVYLESIMLTATIDAKESIDVAIIDITNEFVQMDMEGETVIMKLKDDLAELLVKTLPQLYRKYLINEAGKPVLYVELLKALYCTLKAELLFYKKLKKNLIDKGFKLNPYDACLANMNINNSQFTIVWHVYDLKLSHVYKNEVTKMINWFKSIFEDEEIGKIKVSRGSKHKFLGMNFYFSNTN